MLMSQYIFDFTWTVLYIVAFSLSFFIENKGESILLSIESFCGIAIALFSISTIKDKIKANLQNIGYCVLGLINAGLITYSFYMLIFESYNAIFLSFNVCFLIFGFLRYVMLFHYTKQYVEYTTIV